MRWLTHFALTTLITLYRMREESLSAMCQSTNEQGLLDSILQYQPSQEAEIDRQYIPWTDPDSRAKEDEGALTALRSARASAAADGARLCIVVIAKRCCWLSDYIRGCSSPVLESYFQETRRQSVALFPFLPPILYRLSLLIFVQDQVVYVKRQVMPVLKASLEGTDDAYAVSVLSENQWYSGFRRSIQENPQHAQEIFPQSCILIQFVKDADAEK